MTKKIWCDTCNDWVDEFSTENINPELSWVNCSACGNGLIMSFDNLEKKERIKIAKLIWV